MTTLEQVAEEYFGIDEAFIRDENVRLRQEVAWLAKINRELRHNAILDDEQIKSLKQRIDELEK